MAMFFIPGGAGISLGRPPTTEISSKACSPRARKEVESRLLVWPWPSALRSIQAARAWKVRIKFFEIFMILPILLRVSELAAAGSERAFFEVGVFLENPMGAFLG